jgi:prolyl-tRNA synthetase
LGLKAIPMRADTGPIGGDLSHEFIILAETGESEVYCDREWLSNDVLAADISYDSDLEPFFKKWTSLYAATDEKHDAATCPLAPDQLITARGIEVGHIFSFGTKYSKPMGATVTSPNGEEVPLVMGSYGIGVSRLVGAIIEASHDESGIIWPESVAPFKVALINLRPSDAACTQGADTLYAELGRAGVEVLYDDRDESAGAKFATADLIGLPWQVAIGPRGIAKGIAEVKQRAGGAREELPLDAVTRRFAASAL